MKQLKVNAKASGICPKCEGSGLVKGKNGLEVCPKCNGTGNAK